MPTDEIRIEAFRDAYAPYFASLNYDWIGRGYEIEPHDRKVLDNPFEEIVKPGGEILFAVAEQIPIGSVALVPNGETSFELSKMCVADAWQGKGIGKRLLQSAIDLCRERGKTDIILESNTKQAAAVELYRKFGFIEVELDPLSHYSRVNIRMRLAIT